MAEVDEPYTISFYGGSTRRLFPFRVTDIGGNIRTAVVDTVEARELVQGLTAALASSATQEAGARRVSGEGVSGG